MSLNQILFRNISDQLQVSHIIHNERNDMNRSHLHREYEIYYLAAGTRRFFIENSLYPISAGMLVLIPPATLHRTTCECPEDTGHERILLSFDESYISAVLNSLELPALNDLFPSPVILKLNLKEREQFLEIFGCISDELGGGLACRDAAVRANLVRLLLLLYRCRLDLSHNPGLTDGAATPAPHNAKERLAHEATVYIKNHFREKITLASLAESLFVSKGYVSNVFNEIIGMKVPDYVNLQRIRCAEDLLVHSDFEIAQIADECGFESPSYFSRIFKEIEGMPPQQFRQKKKAEQTLLS